MTALLLFLVISITFEIWLNLTCISTFRLFVCFWNQWNILQLHKHIEFILKKPAFEYICWIRNKAWKLTMPYSFVQSVPLYLYI